MNIEAKKCLAIFSIWLTFFCEESAKGSSFSPSQSGGNTKNVESADEGAILSPRDGRDICKSCMRPQFGKRLCDCGKMCTSARNPALPTASLPNYHLQIPPKICGYSRVFFYTGEL
ncbi:MAG: hypothetical protein ACREOO_03705 [bacterium]